MHKSHHDRAREAFIGCLRLETVDEQQQYLEQACRGDSKLEEAVRSLLDANQNTDSNFERPLGSKLDVEDLDAVTRHRDSIPRSLGDFRIIQEIGRGGMGVVYEAEQLSLGRRVALKVLPFASMLDKTQLARFKNEARAAASLDHPNVVQVHSVGSERGVHYYAMQFIDGQTVADVIAEERRRRGIDEADEQVKQASAAPAARGSFPSDPTEVFVSSGEVIADTRPGFQPEALKDTVNNTNTSGTTRKGGEENSCIRHVVELAIQAAEALEHAHRMGIVHRDIKPSNLLIDAAQHLWVADFGLALVEAEGNITTSGSMLGTLRYMSPEQMRADRHVLDHHTDIYSLGATLYEMLTLRPAFPDTDITQVMRQISSNEPASPRKLNLTIPRDLETIVLKAMAKDYESRYTTAGDMAADLQRFLNDEPIQAKPPGMIERARKWTRRHRSVVATAAVTLLLAIGVAGSLLWRERSATFAALDSETVQRELAEQRLRQAETDFDRALRAVDMVIDQVGSEEFAKVPGMSEVRDDLCQKAIRFYQEIIDEHADEPLARRRLASAYARLAGIYVAMEDDAKRQDACEKAVAILNELLQADPDNLEVKCALAESLQNKAWSISWRNREKQLELFDQSIAFRQEALDQLTDPAVIAEVKNDLAVAYHSMAFHLLDESPARAEPFVRNAIELSDRELDHRAASFRVLAELEWRRQRLNEAEAAARQAIECARDHAAQNPDDRSGLVEVYRAWILLAKILQAHGTSQAADEAYAEALRAAEGLASEYPQFSRYQGWVVEALGRNKAAFRKYVERELNQSRAEILEVLVKRGKEGLLLDYARELKKEGRSAQAQQLLHDVVPLVGAHLVSTSDYHWDHANYARLKVELVRLPIAERKYDEAQQLLNHYHFGLGADFAAQAHWHKARQETDLALDCYSEALSRSPKVFQFLKERGELLLELQRFEEAETDFTQAIGLCPQEWYLHKRRALALFRLGRYDEALEAVTMAVDGDASDTSSLTWIDPAVVANCPEESFREGMMRLADRVVELNDRSGESLIARAQLLLGLGEWEQARGDLHAAHHIIQESLAAENPDVAKRPASLARALNRLAWFLATCPSDAIRDPQRAVQQATKATELSPDESSFWNTLGVAQYRTGDHAGAVKSLNRSLELSNNDLAHNGFFLALSHWQLGDKEEAGKWYEKSVNWMNDNDSTDEELMRFRTEAQETLGIRSEAPETEESRGQQEIKGDPSASDSADTS